MHEKLFQAEYRQCRGLLPVRVDVGCRVIFSKRGGRFVFLSSLMRCTPVSLAASSLLGGGEYEEGSQRGQCEVK